ncbi:MAG: hypothetical protein HOQ24_03615 [Mycobacteriaceae bacterium]|nr:hypothetical protein [Mycobacteriaceae bacterium]
MPTTFQAAVPAADLAATTREYTQRGWTVTETANGVSLITDEKVSGIEVSGKLAEGIRRYLRANNLTGPIIEIPGTERREIHLVTNMAKAELALDTLREIGATVHTDGAGIPLPPTKLSAGSTRWAVAPNEARWTPPAVAIAAAARAVLARGGAVLAARVAS